VEELTMLDFTDGQLVYGLELREAIARVIRQVKPTVILTQDWNVEAPWGLDQADHRAAGLATLDAARDAGNEFLYTDAGPRHQAGTLLVTGSMEPNVAVEIQKRHVEAGAQSLDAHVRYFEALPDHPDGQEIVGGAAASGGEASGAEYAILFRRYAI
jgi:LmbE family N-acetylglucosaminyl deacetylase